MVSLLLLFPTVLRCIIDGPDITWKMQEDVTHLLQNCKLARNLTSTQAEHLAEIMMEVDRSLCDQHLIEYRDLQKKRASVGIRSSDIAAAEKDVDDFWNRLNKLLSREQYDKLIKEALIDKRFDQLINRLGDSQYREVIDRLLRQKIGRIFLMQCKIERGVI
jgi:hypothetical protein